MPNACSGCRHLHVVQIIEAWLNTVDVFPSLKRRGGCASRKRCEATFDGADGVVILQHHSARTTPSALHTDAFGDIFLIARPPLLFKEGNTFSFFNLISQFGLTPVAKV
jgi:hypothetical protein